MVQGGPISAPAVRMSVDSPCYKGTVREVRAGIQPLSHPRGDIPRAGSSQIQTLSPTEGGLVGPPPTHLLLLSSACRSRAGAPPLPFSLQFFMALHL